MALLMLHFSSLVLIAALTSMGLVTTGTLAGGVNLIGGVANGFNSLAGLRLSSRPASHTFASCQWSILDSKSEEVVPMTPLNDSITIDGLSFCYDEKSLSWKDASFRFEKGKNMRIGPSGCGKSTLLKILLGWLPEYHGTIRFDGRDIREYTPEQLQQQMSYIEQNVFLFNASIRENITLDEDFTEEQQWYIHDSALENDLLSMPNGLDTLVGEGGCNISGGQKQRVAIAH